MSKEDEKRPKRYDGEGTRPVEVSPGVWQATVMLGYKPDGSRLRKTVTRSSPEEVVIEVARLRREYKAGKKITVGKTMPLSDWLKSRIDREEALELLEPSTVRGYRAKVGPHVDETRLGKVQLNKLRPKHIEDQYHAMLKAGLARSSLQQLHSVLRKYLKQAVREGLLYGSPMEHVQVPKPRGRVTRKAGPSDALTADEAQKVLVAAREHPRYARWLFGLLLGPRQSEVLAVDWDESVDLDRGVARIFRKLYRKTWSHGCLEVNGGPSCGGKRGADCPDRHGGGLFVGDTKTDMSTRDVPLPGVLVSALKDLKAEHDAWAAQDGRRSTWMTPGGETLDLVFKQRNGRPVDARRDWGEWKDLLEAAGVDPVRVHDMRHTAATMLLVQGVDRRVVMEIMGWSQVQMLMRYQHVVEQLQRDALDKVAGALDLDQPKQSSDGGVVVGLEAFKQRRQAGK